MFLVHGIEDKITEKEFDSICLVGISPVILLGNPKVSKTVVNKIAKF